jgi:hypothetical protein
MWIRVESFEPSSPNTATTVLNFFAGGRHNSKASTTENVDDKAALLLSLGRKAGDIAFPNDRSVSRQHCAIRCVHEPRNDAERRACQANPFQMCLVLENFGGKAGTFIAETPPLAVESSNTKDGDDAATGDNTDDDEATDDEGGGMISQQASQQPSQQQVAALGDGTVAADVNLSASMRHFWKKGQPQLVRLDVGQSRVLDFSQKQRSIMLQAGVKGSTLKVTWVPFSVVFSRVPKEIHYEWKKKLHQIGALEESSITEATTHLITPQILPTAKPLTACCRGIPIVTPDYLQALMDHDQSSKDPLPSVEQYKAPFPEDGTMGVLKAEAADPKLMAGYVVFTLDSTEMDPLFRFAGGTLVPLQEESSEKARLAKTEETLKAFADKKNHQVFLVMSSKKRLFSKLVAMDNIFALKPEAWAKAVAQQEPKLVDVKGDSIPLPSASSSSTPTSSAPQDPDASGGSDTEDEAPASSKERDVNLQTQEELTTTTTTTAREEKVSRKRTGDDSNSSSQQVDSCSMTEIHLPSQKRRRRETPPPVEQAPETETAVHEESPVQDEETPQGENENEDFPVEQDVSMEEEEAPQPEPTKQSRRKNKAEISSASTDSNAQQCLAKPDATGWFTIAPKDNSLRKAWRKKASKMNAEENDGKHFMPPAHSEHVVAIIPPPAAPGGNSNSNGSRDVLGRRPRRSNGPNFKTFRKNIVPRKVDACERISLQVFQARESEQQQRLEVNQRELEEEQRRADELFRDIGAGASKTRRRRQ